jgi:hypothetical protein
MSTFVSHAFFHSEITFHQHEIEWNQSQVIAGAPVIHVCAIASDKNCYVPLKVCTLYIVSRHRRIPRKHLRIACKRENPIHLNNTCNPSCLWTSTVPMPYTQTGASPALYYRISRAHICINWWHICVSNRVTGPAARVLYLPARGGGGVF